MGKVVNFHLPADDVERAARFYRDVFGWDFVPFPNSAVPYLVHDSAGENGAGIPAAITARHDIVKAPTPTIEVESIDQAMANVAMNGGQQGQVRDLPGLGRFGYAIDSEGNIIALLQRTQ
jgi:predicted enzyme related to lactoylglutathione lyase